MHKAKVVCLGFQKTGTSSLGLALEKLGYTPASYDQFRNLVDPDSPVPIDRIGQAIVDTAESLLPSFDAFKDTPWPILYQEMDAWLPGSKFILITRNEDRWIKSVVTDFGEFHNPIHEYIYGVGSPKGNEDIYLERYRRHTAEVLDYFKERPNDFIHLHLDDGEVNWENVCSFLGHQVPDTDWPHANTASQKKRLIMRTRITRRLKQLLPI